MSKLLAFAVVGVLVLGACTSGRGQESTPAVERSPTAPTTAKPTAVASTATQQQPPPSATATPQPTSTPEPVIAANVITVPPSSLPEIDLSQMYQLLGIDTIAPIYDPQFVPASRANIGDLDLVLGVEINGEAKAYPIAPLIRREMVNDVVGGVPILVTW